MSAIETMETKARAIPAGRHAVQASGSRGDLTRAELDAVRRGPDAWLNRYGERSSFLWLLAELGWTALRALVDAPAAERMRRIAEVRSRLGARARRPAPPPDVADEG
jgi:hypothetical protein